jgi:hypothetical protein
LSLSSKIHSEKGKQENRKIFVVSTGRHDISQAEEYGEVIALTEGTISLNMSDLAASLSDKLKDFNQEDYILLSGNLAANFVAGMVMGMKQFQFVKVLIYNSKKLKYFEKTIRREDIW